MSAPFQVRGHPIHGFGLKRSPRDFPHETPSFLPAHAARIFGATGDANLLDEPPEAADNRRLVLDIRDQLQRGACIQFACGQAVRCCQVREGRLNPIFPSPADGDYLCRRTDKNPDMSIDTGTYPETWIEVRSEHGFADEKFGTPYGDQLLDIAKKPDAPYMRLAYDQSDERGKVQTSLVALPGATETERSINLRRAIAARNVFVWTGDVSNAFARNEFDPGIPVDACPPGQSAGGHAICGTSYYTASDGTIVYLLPNSWSKSWANDGWFIATERMILAGTVHVMSHVEIEGDVS